jgi:hypothetical protein
MDRLFGTQPHLYAVSLNFASTTAISEFLSEIHSILEKNKHPDSFGSIFDVGISKSTRVSCCIFGSKRPDLFDVATNLDSGLISVPVLLIKDTIVNAEINNSLTPLSNWLQKPRHATDGKVDLTGYSVGLKDDIYNAGSFGFYGILDQKAYGFTAAHCISEAREGIIVSPSTRELTYQLNVALPYTRFAAPESASGFLSSNKLEEVRNLLNSWDQCDSESGCDIVDNTNESETRRSVKLLGKKFGDVVAVSSGFKRRVLEDHNSQLPTDSQFMLPGDTEGLSEDDKNRLEKDPTRSRIEWCCFEVSEDRCV